MSTGPSSNPEYRAMTFVAMKKTIERLEKENAELRRRIEKAIALIHPRNHVKVKRAEDDIVIVFTSDTFEKLKQALAGKEGE